MIDDTNFQSQLLSSSNFMSLMVEWWPLYSVFKETSSELVASKLPFPSSTLQGYKARESLMLKQSWRQFESPANLCKLVEMMGGEAAEWAAWRGQVPPPSFNASCEFSYSLSKLSLLWIHTIVEFSPLFLEISLSFPPSPILLLLSSSSSLILNALFFFLYVTIPFISIFFSNFWPTYF